MDSPERDDLFGKEMAILEKAKSSLKAAELASQESLSDFGTVIRQYEKLLRQATKLTRLGDGYQRKMLLAYEEIERQKLVLQENERQLEIRNRFIRETFGRYLSDEVVTGLLEAPEGLALGGEKRTVTIMMTDLRGFSALADGLDPEEVVTLLNGYLEVMTGIIQKWAGTIDEFIGDAILGLFGAPLLRPDDAARAAACALEMQLAIPGVNAMNKEKGLPAIEMGIGLHSGEVVVGNIGSRLRAKYGVVGRAVNFASRVESYTVGGQVLISRELREALGPLAVIGSEMQVHPKGMQPVTIYDLVGLGGDYGIRLEQKNVLREKMKQELPSTFIVVEGKDARGEEHRATFVAVSEELLEAEVNSDMPLKPLSNLRFRLLAAPTTDVYAKVLAGEARHGTFIIRFTSLPEAAKHVVAAAR